MLNFIFKNKLIKVIVSNGYELINCVYTQKPAAVYESEAYSNTAPSFTKILKVLVYWSQGLNQSEIYKFVKILRHIVSKIRSLFFSMLNAYFLRNPIKLGGPVIVVQCDKILLNHKAKYNKGRESRLKFGP